MVSVNAASAAALLACTSVMSVTHGPIQTNPEFAVGGAQHVIQKGLHGLHQHLRHPSQFKFNLEGAPAPATESDSKEPEHADANHTEHGGRPGEGGDPMVPRTHEHGDVEADHNYGWSYEKPEDWVKGYKLCGGQKQSPIDLFSKVSKAKEAGNGNLTSALSYTSLCDLRIDNNGHNLQVNGEFGNFTLPSGVYQAAQFNFHFPSEHKVDGKRAAGELQIVHQKVGEDGTNGLAIIAILFKLEDVKEESNGGDVPSHVRSEMDFLQQIGFPPPEILPKPEAAGAPGDKLTSEEQLKEDVESEEEEKKGRRRGCEGG